MMMAMMMKLQNEDTSCITSVFVCLTKTKLFALELFASLISGINYLFWAPAVLKCPFWAVQSHAKFTNKAVERYLAIQNQVLSNFEPMQ